MQHHILLMTFAKQVQTLNHKAKKNNVKEAMKQFPKTKQMLKEIAEEY